MPETIAPQTPGLPLEMLKGSGGRLPHAWVAGDDEMGRPHFRQELRTNNERYLLAVPQSSSSIRDIEVTPPAYSGRG